MTKSICFVGAGASVPFGVPTLAQMTESFEEKISNAPSLESRLYDDLKYRLRDYPIYDLEAMITILQDICHIYEVPKNVFWHPSVVYFSTCAHHYNGMLELMAKFGSRHRGTADDLLQLILGHIGEVCALGSPNFEVYDVLLQRALEGGPGTTGCSIYTTNYDQVLEQYFESKGLDFEVGQSSENRLDLSAQNPRLYGPESSGNRIFKLHGSVNWYADEDKGKHWLDLGTDEGMASMSEEGIIRGRLIYPVVEKLIYREPFYPLFHQLRTDLATADNCYVVGYSFRDDHLLGTFHDALEMNPNLGLVIIDPNAGGIVERKFPAFADRIEIEEREFSGQVTGKVSA